MQIAFRVNPQKSLAAITYVVSKLPGVEKVKLMKLLYLAERAHFIEYGVPITGDRLVAMQHGPLPSTALRIVNGEAVLPEHVVFGAIHVSDNRVTPRETGVTNALSVAERQSLDAVVAKWGHLGPWRVRDMTHELPEFKSCFRAQTSTPIPYEEIARHSNNAARFKDGRAVITPEMAQLMDCPFPADDSDL